MKPSEYPIPRPSALGLDPEKFPAYRTEQAQAIWDVMESPYRFDALVMPTGSGKSLAYTVLALLRDWRATVLTATLALMTQLRGDFKKLPGYYDVRGQSNYPCAIDEAHKATVADGSCHAGVPCELRSGGCSYYDNTRQAREKGKIINTNYSWWLHHGNYGENLGDMDALILDEAHCADEQLSAFLSVQITREDIKLYMGGYEPTQTNWKRWASEQRRKLEAEFDRVKAAHDSDRATIRRIVRGKHLLRRLARLDLTASQSEAEWIFDRAGSGYRWDPVWPGPYAESYLFRGAKKVIFVSATIREKTLALLGVKKGEYGFREYPSSFPKARRPVIALRGTPRLTITYKTPPSIMRYAVAKVDQIVKRRADRKGIIHSRSYERMAYIFDNSRFQKLMLSHEDSKGQPRAVEEFRARSQSSGALLVSPSVTTGLDFPFTQCEYQIIFKVPFPDTKSALIRARMKLDAEYSFYMAMVEIVQAVGRGMRAADDRCETFIIDANFDWFLRRWSKFAPKWFLEAVRFADSIPAAPPRLIQKKGGGSWS